MKRVRIADQIIELEFSDQDFFEKRLQEYAIVDMEQKSDMKLTTCVLDEISVPDGTVIQKVRDAEVLSLKDGTFCRVLYDQKRSRIFHAIYFDKQYTTVRAEIRRDRKVEGLSVTDFEYIFSGSAFSDRLAVIGDAVLHGSAIAFQRQGVIFSAISGVGKSTHAGLWKERFGEIVEIVNDDKPAIRFWDGVPWVYGTPWSGKTDLNRNIAVPLAAVVFLKRDTKNWIELMSISERMYNITNQLMFPFYDEDAGRKLTSFAARLAQSVPMYYLHCDISQEAVEIVRKEIFYKGQEMEKRE